MNKIDTRTFVQNKFSEYYQKHSSEIEPPLMMEKREFGFFLFKEKIVVRHRSFGNVDALRNLLKSMSPSDAYYSCAYYEKPQEPMEKKGWLGADLIFDIDADHISAPCGKIHDTWSCNNCGTIGTIAPPAVCPKCGQRNFNEKTWPCEVCLEAAKVETMKLADFLMKDFGFSENDLLVSYSGHRGYHLQIESEKIRELDQPARMEMVDYLTGTGLETELHGLHEKAIEKRSSILAGPDLADVGWKGRVAKGAYDVLTTANTDGLKKIGLRKADSEKIFKKRVLLLKSWEEKAPWGITKGVGLSVWKKIAQHGVEKQSVKLDTVVTTDIHRLIRLGNTLHGKTGLKKLRVPIADIEQFDPLKSALAFKDGTTTIFVSQSPQIRLGEETYGPYKEQKEELPMAVAMFLLCKGAAKLVE